MDKTILYTIILLSSRVHSSPVTQRVEIIPSKLLTYDDHEGSRLKPGGFQPRQYVSSTPVTAAPLVLETHRVIPNHLFTIPSSGYRTEAPHSFSPQTFPQPSPTFPPLQTTHNLDTLTHAVRSNPVVTALLLSTLLGTRQPVGQNSPEHIPPDPFLALLLSHYGRYLPRPGFQTGLYGYNAANNIHNTRPFGSYKIYDDSS